MKILVIGDNIIDRYIYGLVHRQSPENASIPVVDFVAEEYRLGGAGNVAANVRSLSDRKTEVYISSVLSNFTANLFKQKNIFYDAVILESEKEPHKRELVKTRICHSETHDQFIRLDYNLAFSDGDIQRYINKCYYYNGKEFDAIIVSDYKKGLVNDFLISKLKTANCPIFVDTKNPDLSIWDQIHGKCILKVNSKEYKKCVARSKIHPLIVTKGNKGAELRSPPTRGILYYPTKEVVNGSVVGAGDVFLAGLAVRYIETGGNLPESIEFANRAAAKSVEKFGTIEVKRLEVNLVKVL
jgi:rfaE bifunctional protein kinase chain/domain